MSESYFATKPTTELLQELTKKIETWHRYIERKGLRRKWSKLYSSYFGKQLGEGGSAQSSEIQRVGDEGEFAAIAVNHFRNLIKHQLALTCSQKPSYDPKAKNSDLKSLQQARLAGNIIDDYVVEKRLGRYMKSAAERALAFSKGYVMLRWEPSAGRPYGTEPVMDHETGQPSIDEKTGQPHEKVVYEGDVECEARSAWDVMYDIHLEDWTKRDWDIVRFKRNKFTIAAKYPKFKDQVLGMTSQDDLSEFSSWRDLDELNDGSDMIPLYEFYHKRTDALPNGRYTVFLNGEICLYDGPIQYKRLPIFRITPGEMFDTPEGYSESNDTVMLQDALNVLYSSEFTNLQTFGIQAIWLPEGCDLSSSQIGKGLAVLKGGPPGSEPKPLQLTAIPPALQAAKNSIEKAMETLMGINSVVRGDPEHNLKSGAALGRMQAMAVQFASNFQESWAELQEDTATFLLDLLRDFAKTERMVALAGKHNKGAMKSFTGDDLSGVDRVSIDLGNPMSRTSAGRIDIAQMLMQNGLVKTTQEFFNVLSTGQTESMTEGPQKALDLIRKENEGFMDGKRAAVLVGDAHLLHMQEHLAVIADPELRSLADGGDPEAVAVVEAVLHHIQWHDYTRQTQGLTWCQISGEPPPPPPPPGAPPPQPPPFPNGDYPIPQPAPMSMPPPPPMGPPPGPGGPPPMGPHGPPPPQGLPPSLQAPPGPPGDKGQAPPMPPVPKPPQRPMAG